MQIVVSTDIIKHVLVKHCIQHCLGLQLKFAWGEEWKENQRTCTRELVPLTLISSLGCFKKEEKKKKAEAGYSAEDVAEQKKANPALALRLAPCSSAELRGLL